MYKQGFFYIALMSCAVSGCQTAQLPSSQYASDANYLNKKYVVTKDQAFMGIRDSLIDGQNLTVVQTFRTPQGLLLVKVMDDNQKVLFDKPYALNDLGLVDEIGDPVQKSVDQNKVKQGVFGKQQHGYGKKLFGDTYTYTSTVENTRLDGPIAHGESRRDGLGAICSKGKVFLTVTQSDVIAAPGSSVSYRIYVDRKPTYEVAAQMATYSALFSSPPDALVQDLLQGREGVLRINTLTSVKTVNFRLDGFAEMYARVKNNCPSQ